MEKELSILIVITKKWERSIKFDKKIDTSHDTNHIPEQNIECSEGDENQLINTWNMLL